MPIISNGTRMMQVLRIAHQHACTSKNELSSLGWSQMPHCLSPRLISTLHWSNMRTTHKYSLKRLTPVQAPATILIQGIEACFSAGKLVLQFAFDMLLLAFHYPIRAFRLKPPANCITRARNQPQPQIACK